MKRSTYTMLFIIIFSLSSTGCMSIYNSENDKLASEIKTLYNQTAITTITAQEHKNLDTLLQAELDNVDTLYREKLTAILLNMVDSEQKVVEFRQRNINRLHDIGMLTLDDAHKYLSVQRQSDLILHRTGVYYRQLMGYTPLIPSCSVGTQLPAQAPALKVSHSDALAPNHILAFNTLYDLYRKDCMGFIASLQELDKFPAPNSELMQTQKDLQAINHHLAQQSLLSYRLNQEFTIAKSNYTEALEDHQSIESDDALNDIENKRQTLVKIIDNINKAQQKTDHYLIAEAKIEAIQDILEAMSSASDDTEQLDNKQRSPELATAIEIAQTSPAIASTLKNMHERSKAESLSELLIEMQHQALLINHNKQRRAINLQRQALLQRRQQLLQEEISLRVKSVNYLCHFGAYQNSANTGTPTLKQCNNLMISGNECQFGDLTVSECALAQPWPFTANNFQRDTDAKRALYNSVAQFSQAYIREAQLQKNSFQLIDTEHRKSLVDNQHAIQAWDNIIDVPINQLQAYHEDGIKPEDLSDLIIKAVGLTAIAVAAD